LFCDVKSIFDSFQIFLTIFYMERIPVPVYGLSKPFNRVNAKGGGMA
jgi:hypothetical protein